MKNIYLGNLPDDTTKQDTCESFGLNSASYSQDACNVEFPVNKKTAKFKGFTFKRDPVYITDELIKPDGIAYPDNELRVQEAISTRKRTNNKTSNESQKPSVVVNDYPKKQHSYGKKIFSA